MRRHVIRSLGRVRPTWIVFTNRAIEPRLKIPPRRGVRVFLNRQTGRRVLHEERAQPVGHIGTSNGLGDGRGHLMQSLSGCFDCQDGTHSACTQPELPPLITHISPGTLEEFFGLRVFSGASIALLPHGLALFRPTARYTQAGQQKQSGQQQSHTSIIAPTLNEVKSEVIPARIPRAEPAHRGQDSQRRSSLPASESARRSAVWPCPPAA